MKIAESILKNLQQSILVLDETLQPVFANPAFFKMFDLSSKELDGVSISELINGKNCNPALQEIIKSVETIFPDESGIEVVCTLHTGKKIELMVKARQIYEKGLPKMFLVELRNITQKKEAELQIQELNTTLQQLIATADSVNEELESYCHSVSHDLRTPLRFVSRIAHLLLYEPGTNLSDIPTQRVNMILQATNEMGTLIENLLLFSQVNREPIKKKVVDLRELFQEAVREHEKTNEKRDIKIEIQEMAPCQGDRSLLKEVASNLLSNALKFTNKRKKAIIKIGCTETNDNTIYYIQDNGIGFNAAESKSLFLPFFKLHKAEEFEGSGIGLSLVKRIIERHGGKIWAVSENDNGAVFSFTLR